MNARKIFRSLTALLLSVSILLSLGVGAFAAQPETQAEQKLVTKSASPSAGEIISNKSLSSGTDSEDDKYTITLDAYSYGKIETLKTATPLDVTIVLDRSATMSFAADDSEIMSTQNYTLDQIIAKMDAVRLEMGDDFYDGYFRATSWLRTTRTTAPMATTQGYPHDGWASWEAIRYYDPDGDGQGEWQTWVVNIPSSIHWKDLPFGILGWEATRNAMHYGSWMELHDAMQFHDSRRNSKLGSAATTGYYYMVSVPRLTVAINTISEFIDEVNASSAYLPEGTHHTVSILSYGGAVMDEHFKYYIDSSVGFMNFVDQGVSITCSALDTNYDDIMSTLRHYYLHGNTMTGWALEVVANSKVSTDSYVASASNDYGYLAPAEADRERVVLLFTDGIPTTKTSAFFSAAYADIALQAAKRIKNQGISLYTVGLTPGLDADASPSKFISDSDSYELQNQNTFLTLLSSNYPDATSVQTSNFGNRVNGNYFLVDKGHGTDLAKHFETILSEITTISGTVDSPLALHEELTREFKPDSDRTADVYVAPYLGNGVFGERVLIGSHYLGDSGAQFDVGLGYTLSQNAEEKDITLVWTDAMYGYLRETDIAKSAGCYPQYTKGYKILVEIPIEVDRNNTVGGDNIPTSLPSSGLYYVDEELNIITERPALDTNGNAITDEVGNPVMESAVLISYDIPYVNIQMSEPIYDGTLQFGHSLTLENDISINFIGKGEQLDAYDSFYLECKVPVYSGNELVDYETVNIDPVSNGLNYEFTLTGITAKMMNDEVEAVFRLFKGNQEYYSKTDTYSVAEYAYGKLNSTKAGDTDALKAVCANLLRYGAYAQELFAYRTDALVTADFTPEHNSYLTVLSTVPLTDNRKQLTDLEAPTVPWKSTTIELGNKVIMCLIVNLADYTGDVSELTMRLSYTDAKGKTITEALPLSLSNADSKTYSVSYDGLRATEMRTIVSAAIYNGDTRVSKTVEYSIESYAARNPSNVCLAMLAYGDSAKIFFAN